MHLFGIRRIRYFFAKKERKVFVIKKNFVPLQPQTRNKGCESLSDIGLWCNGNTTDSGPVISGSSPDSPTKRAKFSYKTSLSLLVFFPIYNFRI